MSDEADSKQQPRDTTESGLLSHSDGSHWVEWLATIIVVVAFTIAGGIGGALAGIVTAGVWFGLGTPYALAAGVVLLTGLTHDGLASLSVMLVATGLLAALLAPVAIVGKPGTYAITVLFTTGVFGGLTWILVASQPLWLVGTVLLASIVLFGYFLSRYQQLRLGLLDDDHGTPNEVSADSPTAETETS